MGIKEKWKNRKKITVAKRDKVLAAKICTAFVAITTGLVGTSYFLNFEKAKQEVETTAQSLGLTRNIVQVSDEDVLAKAYDSNQYTKIGENVYVVNYDTHEEAEEGVGKEEIARMNGISEMDTLFVTAYDTSVPADDESSNSSGYQMTDSVSDDDIVPLDASDLEGVLEEANPEDMIVEKEEDASKYEVASLPEGYTAKQFANEQGNKLVAVIDTGADTGVVSSVNFTDEEDEDENGHGTTIVKKILDSADGKATIVSLKAINKNGKGLMTDVYKAVKWAIDNDVDVINMSICAYDDGNQTIFKSLIQEALDKGITVVASAGNYNSDVKNYLPANIKGVISVGTRNGILKGASSNYGDITYFEEEDSTSEATAKITGMIASGKDLSNEKTKADIRYDETEVNKDPVNNSDMDFKVQVNARHNVNYNLNGGAYSVAHKEGENWIFPNGEYAFRSYYSDYVASGKCTPGQAGHIYVTQDMINQLNQPVYLHAAGEDADYLVTYRGYGNGNSTWRLERYKNTEWYFIINTSSGKLLYDTSGNAGGYLKIGAQALDGRFIWRFKEITTDSGKKAVKIVNNATGQTPTVQYVEYFQTYQNSGNGLRIKAFSQNDGDDGAWTVVKVSDRDSRVKQYGYPFYTESSYINPPKPGYTFGGWCTSPSNYLDNNGVRKTSSSSHIKSYRITQIPSQEGGVRFQILAKGDSAVSAISVAMWAMNGGTTTSAQDSIKWAYLGRGSWNGEDGAGTYNFGCEVEYNPSAKDSLNGLVCFDFYYNDNAYAACGATYFAPVYGTEFNYTFDREGKDATLYAMYEIDPTSDKESAGTQYATGPYALTEDNQFNSLKTETEYKAYDLGDLNKWGLVGMAAFNNKDNGTANQLNIKAISLAHEKAYIPIATTPGQTYYYNFNYKAVYSNNGGGGYGEFRTLSAKPGTLSTQYANTQPVEDDKNPNNIVISKTTLPPDKTNCQGSFTAKSDVTYITFDFHNISDNGGSVVFDFDDILITTQPNPHTLSNPTRAGYELTKWTENADGTGTAYKAGDKVNLTKADKTYYAQWKALITESPLNVNLGTWNGNSYTYNKNSNGMYNNKEADSQKGYKVATVDYKAIFEGSTTASTKQKVSENKTKVQIDSTVKLSNLTMMNGYKFEAWEGSGAGTNKDTSFKVTAPDSSGKSTNETTLKARGVSYNVVFHNNSTKGVNGTPDDDQAVLAKGSMANQTLHFGSKETLNENKFTWEGHRFLGWSTTPNGTSVTTYNGVNLTNKATGFFDGLGQLKDVHEDGSTVHLYAVWETLETTVKLDSTSLGSVPSSQAKTKTAKWGTSFSFVNATPNNISATLIYDFNADGVKWADSQPSGVSDTAKNSKTDKSKLEFKEWIITDPATGIAPTDNNGSWGYFRNANTYVFGARGATLKAEYYFTRVVLPKPEKSGYEFVGWYYDKDYTRFAGNAGDEFRATDSTQSTKETLYAKWTKNTYGYTDTMDYQIMDKTTEKMPHVWIRKISTAGKVLTTVDTPLGKQGFTIKISEGSTYNESKVVLVLDTSKGILDKNGNTKIALNGTGYNKTSGFYDISALLEPGKTYTAHETEAAAGWSKDIEDKTFTCQGVKSTLDQAKAELAKAKADLDKASTSEELKKAQAAYDKALKNVETIENAYVNISFKDEQMPVPPPHGDALPWKHSIDGTALSGVSFDLYDVTNGNKKIWSFKTTDEGDLPGDIRKYLQPGHTIKFVEAQAPFGYKVADLTVTVPDKVTNYEFLKNVVDEDNTAELRLLKVDNDGNAIKGTVFKLYVKDNDGNLEEARYTVIDGKKVLANPNKEVYDTATPYPEVATGSDGIASFGKVRTAATYYGESSDEATKSYYVQEVKASEGYALNSDIIQLTLEDIDNSVQTFDVHDNSSVSITLPTGGKGSYPYYIYGSTMLMGALLILLKKKKEELGK